MKKNSKKGGYRLLVTCILLALCLYAIMQLVHYAAGSISARRTNKELQAIFAADKQTPSSATPTPASSLTANSTPEPQLLDNYQYIGDTILPKLENIIAKNPDTVAWLHIPGGIVDLPVVYRDNTFYLDHDFYGDQSNSGTLFLDENHPFMQDTQYLVIHGHNLHDGSMFGMLSHYRKKGYMEDHPTVYLHTLYRQEEYEVIGVLYVPGDIQSKEYLPYIGMRKFQSLDQFYDFTKTIQKSALHWKDDTQIMPNDAFLALSTCYGENRVVVICRRTHPQ